MLGQVQPQQLLLPAQPLADRDLGGGGQRALEDLGVGRGQVEQRRLSGDPVALRRLGRGDRVVQAQQQLGGMAHRGQRADLDQRLEHLAVGEAQIDPGAEVGERPELAAGIPRRDDRFDGALAHVLHGQQAEPDGVALDGEFEMAAVDVRRSHLDRHAPALGDRRGDLLLVGSEGGQDGGHVVDRVVRLEVRRLVGDQPVARGMGLVEAVALERLERLEHRVDDLGLDAAFGGLADELLLLGAQDARLLLADRVAEGVRLRAGEPAEGYRGGHDVLLVDEDAVRLLEVGLEQRVEVGHRLQAVLAPDVGRDVVHRPRPVERHHGREVVHRGRAQLADVAPHAGRLELEDAGRLAAGQELERLRVVERDGVQVDDDVPVLAHEVHRLAQDREVGQAQEIELQQAHRLDGVHLELGHQRVGVGRLLERHELGQRLAADDDAGGVGAGVAGHALEVAGEVDDALDRRVRIDLFAQRGGDLERLVELDPELVGDGLREAVDLAVARGPAPGRRRGSRPGRASCRT